MGNKDILKHTTATNLMLRLFIGGFLIYMAYEILTTLQDATSANKTVLIAFSVLFILSGTVIGVHSLYCLIKHKYYDPMTDQTNDQNSAQANDQNSAQANDQDNTQANNQDSVQTNDQDSDQGND